jgi:hypothetical protein
MTMPEIMHSTRREGWPIFGGKYDVYRATAHNFLVWIIGPEARANMQERA